MDRKKKENFNFNNINIIINYNMAVKCREESLGKFISYSVPEKIYTQFKGTVVGDFVGPFWPHAWIGLAEKRNTSTSFYIFLLLLGFLVAILKF